MKAMAGARCALLALFCAAIGAAGFPGAAQAAGPPEITALWVTDVNPTAARLRATVNPNGFSTTLRFEYITAAAYQANVEAAKDGFAGALKVPSGSPIPIGAGTTPVTPTAQQLGQLKPGTAYRHRLIATNTAPGSDTSETRTFTTGENAPVFRLPDDRGWEMVSPADKNGGAIEGPEALFGGGVFQAAAQGSAVTYSSASSFASAVGSPGASQYIGRRTATGWATENITLPLLSGEYGDDPDGVPYQLFATDLSRALHHNGRRCAEAEPCPRSYSLRQSANGALTTSPAQDGLRFAGANGDLSQIVFEGDDLYRWSGGALEPINYKPGEPTTTAGAQLAAASGAISASGARIYWSVEGDLYLREGGQSYLVDEEASFETASSDGAVAFFTKAGHLYRFAAAGKTSTDLTPGGEVAGVLGASAGGTRVYYLGGAGLALWNNGITSAVAAAADSSSYPPATGTARVSGDGSRLAFVASARITEYDNDGKAEVYLYSLAADSLTCVSCNPSGERPLGPASLPGAIANGSAYQGYKPRVLLESVNRLYFDSFDSLAVQDTNNDRDVYQWQGQGTGSCTRPGGCINLISSGRAEDGARFIDASADGSDVFFTTDASLVYNDPGSVDLYDARVGGGFPVPVPPIPCNGDACQPLPGEPEDPTPGTLLVKPSANPPLSFPKEKGKKKNGKKKNGKGKKKGGKGAGKKSGKRNRGGRR